MEVGAQVEEHLLAAPDATRSNGGSRRVVGDATPDDTRRDGAARDDADMDGLEARPQRTDHLATRLVVIADGMERRWRSNESGADRLAVPAVGDPG